MIKLIEKIFSNKKSRDIALLTIFGIALLIVLGIKYHNDILDLLIMTFGLLSITFLLKLVFTDVI